MERVFKNAGQGSLLTPRMTSSSDRSTILTIEVSFRPGFQNAFSDWHAKLHTAIALFPGFISLEIVAQSHFPKPEWLIVQRFQNHEFLKKWQKSEEYRTLLTQFKELLGKHRENSLKEQELEVSTLHGGVTEIFITQLHPGMDVEYRSWVAKIHKIEARFPGFRGVYVQSPTTSSEKNWLTLLQFDTIENLDRWLASSERQEVLKEAQILTQSLENHRVISSYAGWFSSIAQRGKLPPVWKQTMLVLLVLFPIVMLEFQFLSPWTSKYPLSLATFIGNAISVILISWPMMPIAIYFLRWWLLPKVSTWTNTIIGTLIVLILYFFEIFIFT